MKYYVVMTKHNKVGDVFVSEDFDTIETCKRIMLDGKHGLSCPIEDVRDIFEVDQDTFNDVVCGNGEAITCLQNYCEMVHGS